MKTVALNKPRYPKNFCGKKDGYKKIAITNKTDVIVKAETKPEPEKQKTPIKTQQQATKKESLTAVPNPSTKTIAVTNIPVISTPPAKTTTEPKKSGETTAITGKNR